MGFKDRTEAGKQLAEKLEEYSGRDTVIFALPRGGVVVGVEVAKKLKAPLDLIITRKIGHPNSPEYAIAATTEGGYLAKNEEALAVVNPTWFKEAVEKERREAKRRRLVYLAGKPPVQVQGKIAILVDDGIATGLTMQAAVFELRSKKPKEIIVAVPVVPKDTALELKVLVDRLVDLDTPEHFLGSIGAYYENFAQISDKEVIEILSHLQAAPTLK